MSDNNMTDNTNNEGAGGMKWLAFIFPLVGIICYFMWKDERPTASSEMIKFALYGIGFGVGMSILLIGVSCVCFAGALAVPAL